MKSLFNSDENKVLSINTYIFFEEVLDNTTKTLPKLFP